MLEAKGAKVSLYDPAGFGNEDAEIARSIRRTLNEAVEGTDCAIFLTEHEQLKRLNLKKLRAIMRTPAALIDLVGAIEPGKAEEEGFTYRGLGRGALKK
jgi:UDPglucose 6-dehydrogenase